MDLHGMSPLDEHGQRAATYSLRAPDTPHIHIPTLPSEAELELPAYHDLGGEDLTSEDLKNIAQVHHVAVDQTSKWKYEWRRSAQMILPFLYLGPLVAAKDKEFLQAAGITMLLVIRDTKSAQARLLCADKAAHELGIASAAIDVAGTQELIAAFPCVTKTINDHLLAVYRSQNIHTSNLGNESVTINQNTFQRGKVLVFCESGNERSACVVVAYIMAIYGMGIIQAVQFVQSQRFCVALDDALKGILWSWHDILQAKRDVREAQTQMQSASCNVNDWLQVPVPGGKVNFVSVRKKSKRQIEETVDDEMEVEGSGGLDRDRFDGRRNFAPFLDNSDSATQGFSPL
jgi:serine/threonine/tyrosine-interacting protein